MLCEECGINEATVHIQAIAPDGTTSSKALCQSCMEKFKSSRLGMGAVDISKFLGSIFGHLAAKAELSGAAEKFEGKCGVCGTEYSSFARSGMLGCPACYKAFRERVEENLIKINGSALYVAEGERLERTESPALRARRLRDEMKKAVENEEFETAAALRDELRQLEMQLAAGKEVHGA